MGIYCSADIAVRDDPNAFNDPPVDPFSFGTPIEACLIQPQLTRCDGARSKYSSNSDPPSKEKIETNLIICDIIQIISVNRLLVRVNWMGKEGDRILNLMGVPNDAWYRRASPRDLIRLHTWNRTLKLTAYEMENGELMGSLTVYRLFESQPYILNTVLCKLNINK